MRVRHGAGAEEITGGWQGTEYLPSCLAILLGVEKEHNMPSHQFSAECADS